MFGQGSIVRGDHPRTGVSDLHVLGRGGGDTAEGEVRERMQCWEWRGCGSSDPGITVKPMMGEQASQPPPKLLMAIQEALR